MIDSVVPEEFLARYVVRSGWIRSDRTVRKDAFIPRDSELSVTRHLHLTEENIWNIGRRIAEKRSCTLYGRADVETRHVLAQGLDVMAQPVPDNPNHANIINWPAEKDARIMCALQIAEAARFVANHEG